MATTGNIPTLGFNAPALGAVVLFGFGEWGVGAPGTGQLAAFTLHGYARQSLSLVGVAQQGFNLEGEAVAAFGLAGYAQQTLDLAGSAVQSITLDGDGGP